MVPRFSDWSAIPIDRQLITPQIKANKAYWFGIQIASMEVIADNAWKPGGDRIGVLKSNPDSFHERRAIVSNHAMNSESGNRYHANSENDTHPHEGPCRLQYMIAYLLEKNEELRMQLKARDSEDKA